MYFFGVLVVGLMLARPVLAQAPVPKPADLLGDWVRQGENELGITFRADSTFVMRMGSTPLSNGDQSMNLSMNLVGRWRLAADTLVITHASLGVQETVAPDAGETDEGLRNMMGGDMNRLVKFNGRVLRLINPKKATQQVYERPANSKP